MDRFASPSGIPHIARQKLQVPYELPGFECRHEKIPPSDEDCG
jgi:hypothetical protein